MIYRLQDKLDIDFWTRTFQKDLRCRVTDLMPESAAQAMEKEIHSNAEFKQAHIINNQYREISKSEFSHLSPEERSHLVRNVYQQAQKGIGFWYGRNGLDDTVAAPLTEIYRWLSSSETLNAVRAITGNPALSGPTAQITAFSPGDFLTRHRDEVTSERRRIAFVLNLTQDWHPDWGGLLQFFEDSGETRDSWTPLFNSLCLFDVKHVHSVTCVAPFAPKRRIAISGWFHE